VSVNFLCLALLVLLRPDLIVELGLTQIIPLRMLLASRAAAPWSPYLPYDALSLINVRLWSLCILDTTET
jgi:hypothetical protein